MKHLLTALMVFTIITIGCEKKTTDSNNNDRNVQSYSTLNVINTTDYFNFATNSGSTDSTADHDIVFYSELWNPTGAPADIIIDDPRFKVKEGVSIAVINFTNLEEIDEVPNTADFVEDFISKEGEWYYETVTNNAHYIIPYEKVYIVNTADGKFPAFQITSYYDDMLNSGIYSIDWKYLYE